MTPEQDRQLELIEQELETTDPALVILAERVSGSSPRTRLHPFGVAGLALGCAALMSAIVILFGAAGTMFVGLGVVMALVVWLCWRSLGARPGTATDGPAEQPGDGLPP